MKQKKIRETIWVTFLLTLLVLPPSGWAGSFTVTDAPEFQEALDTTAVNSQNDTINVTAGTYNVTTALTCWSSEDYSLTIIGAGVGSTILDGGNSTQILNLETTDSPMNIFSAIFLSSFVG